MSVVLLIGFVFQATPPASTTPKAKGRPAKEERMEEEQEGDTTEEEIEKVN